MGQRAVAVHPGHHCDTPVLGSRVGHREPAREVCLRLGVRVSVVLMPQHRFGAVRLLEHRLIPVEAYVGTDEITRDAGEDLVGDEPPHELTARNRVRCHGLRVESRHAEPPVGKAGEEFLRLLVARGDSASSLASVNASNASSTTK